MLISEFKGDLSVRSNQQFTDAASAASFGVDGAGSLDRVKPKLAVEFAYKGTVGVGEHDIDASLG